MYRLLLGIALFFPAGLLAQSIVDPLKFPPALREAVEHPENSPRVRCVITPFKPVLNYRFRFLAGYYLRIPLSQYLGRGHGWAVVTKITPQVPEGAQSVYLVRTASLPEVPKTNQFGQIGGGYLLGEGRYTIEWTLFDDSKRVCHQSDKINVALSKGERNAKLDIPPNSVAEASLRGTNFPRMVKDDVPPIRLTVLLHAAPLSFRRMRLGAPDALVLLSGLSSLLERVPSPSVRLVVFNMEQQKELYREEDFRLESLDKVTQAILGLELGVVDVSALQAHAPAQFFTNLVNREMRRENPSEVVLVLGPAGRTADKTAMEGLEQRHENTPFFYQFQFRAFYGSSDRHFPDTIMRTIRALRGKTIDIHSAADFANAIVQLEGYAAK